MSGEPILDALAEAAEAAAAVFRRRAAMARPLWPAEGPASTVLDRARQMDPTLGAGQADVLSELEAAGREGTTPGSIASALSHDRPNVEITLGALANHGLVEKDTSVDPHIYRLSPALQGAGTDGRQPDD